LRLRAGIVLGIIAIILVLSALPASWYSIHAVGPDFRTVGPDGPVPEDETRQLDGQWTLYEFHFYNATWEDTDSSPEGRWETSPIRDGTGEEGTGPNDDAREVISVVTIALGTGIGALLLGTFGIWNIAREDRFRWFTAASFFLAAVLFLGACYHMGMGLPEAMRSDSYSGHEDSYGALFAPYIDPEGGEPGYYFEFDGGYPAEEPWLREQLQYGPGSGWWLAGAAGIFALMASAVLVAAPSLRDEMEGTGKALEVVRYVPVPTVTNVKRRRRYPKRMPAVSRHSPIYKRRKG
jgi:hypothetical protein